MCARVRARVRVCVRVRARVFYLDRARGGALPRDVGYDLGDDLSHLRDARSVDREHGRDGAGLVVQLDERSAWRLAANEVLPVPAVVARRGRREELGESEGSSTRRPVAQLVTSTPSAYTVTLVLWYAELAMLVSEQLPADAVGTMRLSVGFDSASVSVCGETMRRSTVPVHVPEGCPSHV